MSGRHLVVAFAFATLIAASACEPTFVSPVPTSPCYVGTFTLQGAQFSAPIQTPIGAVSVTLLPGPSVTLSTTNGTWTLTGTEQVSVTGAFTGQVTIEGTASGTFTATDTTLDFVVTSLSGTATINGTTVGGAVIDQTISLSQSGLEGVIGLEGQATYSCGSDGLSLTFTSLKLDF